MEFYIEINKSTSDWTYYLRFRKYPEQRVGPLLATFNPYTRAQNPGLVDEIVKTLNEQMGGA